MLEGWVKIYRTLSSKGYYKRSKYVHLWVHLLLKANHSGSAFFWKGEEIVLEPGQFVTGRKKLSEETGIKESTIERILTCFENEQQIEQQKTTGFRLITLVSWNQYQQSGQRFEQQTDNKRTTNEQQTNTNKKERKKEEKKVSLIEEKQTFGRSDINEVIDCLTAYLNGATLDGSQKENRRFAKLLIDKIQKDYPNLNPVEQIRILIDAAAKDKFLSKQMTSIKWLYYNTQKIVINGKQQQQTSIDPVKSWKEETLQQFNLVDQSNDKDS